MGAPEQTRAYVPADGDGDGMVKFYQEQCIGHGAIFKTEEGALYMQGLDDNKFYFVSPMTDETHREFDAQRRVHDEMPLDEFYAFMNQGRAEHGLPPLTEDEERAADVVEFQTYELWLFRLERNRAPHIRTNACLSVARPQSHRGSNV